ncbi:ClpP/crotonase-like domain-containing protein [Hyaloraphidium curvatum]|nr:ClpP/crotonase-like domain-containing protein [Hyaloraphidium curvatum]
MLERDDRVKAVILTGRGRAFAAGASFHTAGAKAFDYSAVTQHAHRDGTGRGVVAISHFTKPVIAAINGPAVGAGITVTLPCDIRVAWKDAKIGFVFARRGIVPDACSSYYLPQLIGKSRTLSLFLTGEVLPASHRLFDGLFHTLVDTPEQVLPAAKELARMIATHCSPVSIALTKDLVWHDAGSADGQHLLDSAALWHVGTGPDSKEGVASFLEKRDPKFVGNVTKVGNGSNGGEYGMPQIWPWYRHVNTNDPTGKNWPDVPVKNLEEFEPFLVELRGPKNQKGKL